MFFLRRVEDVENNWDSSPESSIISTCSEVVFAVPSKWSKSLWSCLSDNFKTGDKDRRMEEVVGTLGIGLKRDVRVDELVKW